MQKLGDDSVTITLRMSLKDVERLDRFAEKQDRNRSQAARQILLFGLDIYEDWQKIGLVQAADFTIKLKEACRDFVQKRQPRLF